MSDQLPNSSHLDAWKKAAARSAPGGDVAALNWVTPEGIVVRPLYTKVDGEVLPYADTLPGFEPSPWDLSSPPGAGFAMALPFRSALMPE